LSIASSFIIYKTTSRRKETKEREKRTLTEAEPEEVVEPSNGIGGC